MAWADDEVGAEKVFHPSHFILDLRRRSPVQHALGVDPAQKRYFSLEIPGERFGIHVLRPGLERMETIHARLDQTINHPMDGPAGMKNHLIAVAVSLFGETAEPRKDEFFEMGRAAERAAPIMNRSGHRRNFLNISIAFQ